MRKLRRKRGRILAYVLLGMLFINFLGMVRAVFFINNDTKTQFSLQYEKNINLYYPRGTIYDENNIAYTNRIEDKAVSNVPKNNCVKVGKTFIGNIKIDETNTTRMGGKGISGLELFYDNYLNGGNPIKVVASVDGVGKIVEGEDIMVYNDHINEGCDIITTTDYHMQKILEDNLDEYLNNNNGKSACAILCEIKTGKIKAMSSSGSQMNTTLLSYQPGSVFKILTLLVALEEGVITIDEEFNCLGEFMVGGTKKECNKEGGHGKITLKDAFAYSCNYVFYEVAKRLNIYDEKGNIVGNKILDYAKKIGINQYGEERGKKLFELEYDDYYSFVMNNLNNDMDIFNLALGQGNTQLSPYLMNTILCAIINEGSAPTPYIVNKITDPSGRIVLKVSPNSFNLDLKEKTVSDIKECLKATCEYGTGKSSIEYNLGKIAGKTGTAEHIDGKNPHSWFVGYFSVEDEKYALSVMVEQGGYGSGAAKKIFEQIAYQIMLLNK